MPFAFKQFNIEQSVNAHKVGTDSMVLGAWVRGKFNSILDIGTGTGILALMQAQLHPKATVIGIEPNSDSCSEAKFNFQNSPFNTRLTAESSKIQDYQPNQSFDLIISNPPYFVNSSLSEKKDKNSARHTVNLSIPELYKHVERLLDTNGQFSTIFPSNLLAQHIASAKDNQLFPHSICIIETEDQLPIRHLITFKKNSVIPIEKTMIVKYASGLYSKAYVDLTIDFHNKNLPFKDL